MRYAAMKAAAPRREVTFSCWERGMVSQSDRLQPDECALEQADNLWWQPGGLRTRPVLTAGGHFSRGTGGLTPMRQIEQAVSYSWWTEEDTVNGQAVTRLFRLDANGNRVAVGDPLPTTGAVITPTVDGWLAIGYNRVYKLIGAAGGWVDCADEVYVPTVRRGAHGCLPTDVKPLDGREDEEYNRLTDRFSVSYTTDGLSPRFYLPVSGLANEAVTAVLTTDAGLQITYRVAAGQVDSAAADGRFMRVSRQGGYVQFRSALWDDMDDPPPVSGRQDNLVITAAKTGIGGGSAIWGMRMGSWLTGDDRRAILVMAGSGLDPSRICWSAAGNPLYFPVSHTARVGDPQGYIMALQPLRDRLLLFKKSCIYMLTATTAIGAEPEKVYVTLYPSATGCDKPKTLCVGDDRLFWVDTQQRVRSLSFAQMTTRQPPALLSTAVTDQLRQALTAAAGDVSSAWWRGMYLLRVGHAVWTLRLTREGSPAWSRWLLDERLIPDQMAVVGDRLELLCRDVENGQPTWVVYHPQDGEQGEDRLRLSGQTVTAPIAYAARTAPWDGDLPHDKRLEAAAVDADLPARALTINWQVDGGRPERLRLLPGHASGHWLPFRLPRFRRLAISFAGEGFLRLKRLRIQVR